MMLRPDGSNRPFFKKIILCIIILAAVTVITKVLYDKAVGGMLLRANPANPGLHAKKVNKAEKKEVFENKPLRIEVKLDKLGLSKLPVEIDYEEFSGDKSSLDRIKNEFESAASIIEKKGGKVAYPCVSLKTPYFALDGKYPDLCISDGTMVVNNKMTDLCCPENLLDIAMLMSIHATVNMRLQGQNHKQFLDSKEKFWNSIRYSVKKGGLILVEDFERNTGGAV